MASLFARRLPLVALLSLAALQAKAGTLTSTLSLGPASITAPFTIGGLDGEQSILFTVTGPGPFYLDADFVEASFDPEPYCNAVDGSLPFTCEGNAGATVTISPTGVRIDADVDFYCVGPESGPGSGCEVSYEFDDFYVDCGDGPTNGGEPNCTIDTMDLPVGYYSLNISQREGMSSDYNSTITPFSDSVEATLTGNVITGAPEPRAGPFFFLLLAALLRFVPARPWQGATK